MTNSHLLFHSSRPLVCLPSAFQPAYRVTVYQPTAAILLTPPGICVSFLNLHAVCRFGKLCEEIRFNKWVLFEMRSNSGETCYRQVYCFCLVHKAIAASLIYSCTGCLQRHIIMLTHILLKILQSLTVCVGFKFSSMASAQSDTPVCQNVVVSGAKCHFLY